MAKNRSVRTVKRTAQFKRDFKRVKRGVHGSHLDETLLEALTLLAADVSLPLRYIDHQMKVSSKTVATAICDPTSCWSTGKWILTFWNLFGLGPTHSSRSEDIRANTDLNDDLQNPYSWVRFPPEPPMILHKKLINIDLYRNSDFHYRLKYHFGN